MKKILFVIDALEFGGGERCFAQLMAGLPHDQYEVYLASSENRRLLDSLKGCVHLIPLDFSRQINPTLFKRLEEAIRKNRINIVHGQGSRAEFYARVAAHSVPDVKYVSTIAMPVWGYDVGWGRKKIYEILERATNRYVDQFIVVSDFLKKELCRLTAIPPDKIIRIYNGVETGIYSADARQEGRRRIREEFSLGEHDMVVGAVGRLVWQKGFKHLLKCLPDVLRDASQIKMLIVGEGPLRAELESLSKELGVNRSIIFTGERRDIPDVLAAIDIMVVPSVLEGFPMVTLEAMAMEKPIVATAIPGITEQITNGKEGLLVPPEEPVALANAILRIANDPYFAQELGRASRRRVESEFSIEQMVELTMKTYEKLLSTGNRDGRK